MQSVNKECNRICKHDLHVPTLSRLTRFGGAGQSMTSARIMTARVERTVSEERGDVGPPTPQRVCIPCQQSLVFQWMVNTESVALKSRVVGAPAARLRLHAEGVSIIAIALLPSTTSPIHGQGLEHLSNTVFAHMQAPNAVAYPAPPPSEVRLIIASILRRLPLT